MSSLPTTPEDATTWLPVVSSLTARDRELFAHLAEGWSTSQIAAAMGVSTNTARTRFRRLAGKMDAALAPLDGQRVPPDLTPGLPPLSDGLLSRPRLLDALSRGVETTPVTLISGRIESGKTVLAPCWADAQPADAPPTWLPLGTGHDEPPRVQWRLWSGPGAVHVNAPSPPRAAARRSARTTH